MNKSSHKISRNSRGPPVRKDHMMKKTMHISAPLRNSSTSSRPMLKRLSPGGMKRGPLLPPPSTRHHSRGRPLLPAPHRSPPPHRSVTTRHSMQQSPAAMDRGVKRIKYDKRKMSPSPIRHPMQSSSVAMLAPPPYRNERYMNVRPVATHPPHYASPPPKKKNRREADKFDHGGPLLRRPDIPPHSESRLVQRGEMPSSRPMASMPHPGLHRGHMTSSIHNERTGHFDGRGRGRGGPTSISSHSKRPPPPPIKPSYSTQRNERYRSPSPPTNQYSDVEKHYAPPTLHERFSSVTEVNMDEPRVKYSREDLEKITIDIHRNLKAESPTVRRIVNPNDVKLVRRANEGHRPMFDREEIKQAPRDMRDDAHWEKNVMKSGGGYGGSGHSIRGNENYEITRNRFDPHHQTFHSTGGRSLSDRFQNADMRKDGVPLDRDHRESDYERQPMKRSFSDSRPSKAGGGDRDFRSERFSGPSTSHGRPEYPTSHHILPPPSEPRNSSSIHRKPIIAPMDARRKLTVRRGSDRGPPPSIRSEPKRHFAPLDKRYLEGMPPRIDKPIDRRSPIREPPAWKRNSRSDSRERMSSSSRRPDKFSYNSEKLDGPSKSSNYYEDNRDNSNSYRGRGSRPFRGSTRGFRSRGSTRGSPRGSFPSRSTFRGSSYRGRGAPRRGRSSPGIWENGMYPRNDN